MGRDDTEGTIVRQVENGDFIKFTPQSTEERTFHQSVMSLMQDNRTQPVLDRKTSSTGVPEQFASSEQLMSQMKGLEVKERKSAAERSEGAATTHKLGDTTVKLARDKDGRNSISEITLPNGVRIYKQDGKFVSTDGAVDQVKLNKEAKAIEIKWARTKAGVDETSLIRQTGVESLYSPPVKRFGVENVKSIELSKEDGRRELRLRTDSDEIHRFAVISKPGEKLKVKPQDRTDAPSELAVEDLPRGAREAAHLIKKNNGTFGNEQDKAYFKDLYYQFLKHAGKTDRDFEDSINDILKKQKSDFRVNVLSIRDNSDDTILLVDKTKRGQPVDSITAPKK